MDKFLKEINTGLTPDETDNVFAGIWKEYERVILHSIITTFGLDFIIKDAIGGDVDTIFNVRNTSTYKNKANQSDYMNQAKYDGVLYHKDARYRQTIKLVRESQSFLEDGYVPGSKIYYGKASSIIEKGQKANLDHVIAAKEIHEDSGRILAGIDGVELANRPENLVFTNEHLNKSMGADSIPDYISKHPELLDEQKEAMMTAYEKARESYERAICKEYYSSDKFLFDVSKAAITLGAKMAIRQAIGFVFVEIWIACKKELSSVSPKAEISNYFSAMKNGVENAITTIKEKYKDLFAALGEGFVSGIVTSITTTLINVFITTDKNTVRNIRQVCICLTQAGNVLLFNPNSLATGDRLKLTTVIIATGASSLVGMNIGDIVDKTPLGDIPTVGHLMKTFISSFVSGILSCTLLLMLDRSDFINKVIDSLNEYQPVENVFLETSKEFSRISSEIAQFNLDEYYAEIEKYCDISEKISFQTDDFINTQLLKNWFEYNNVNLPWTGDFDEFMSNPSNKLIFS